MILNVKEKSLNNVKLSEKECRLLMALISNRLVLTEDIFQFIYGTKLTSRKRMVRNLSVLKNRFIKKTNLRIQTRQELGYILQDIVEVE